MSTVNGSVGEVAREDLARGEEIGIGALAGNRPHHQRIATALAPAAPLVLGTLALVGLFWTGHLGVKRAVGDTNILAEAEMQSALAITVPDSSLHLSNALALMVRAGERASQGEVSEIVGSRQESEDVRLAAVVSLFSDRRSSRQRGAEHRFLAMVATGIALNVTGGGLSFFFWRRRWVERWDRVRRLSGEVELLARAPLDAHFTPSGSADELGRVEDALARVAPQLADTLVHQQRLSLLGEQVAFVAHDIRTPLGSILMGLSLVPEDALDKETRDMLLSEVRRATELASELRDFARRSDSVQACALETELEASAKVVQHRAREKGVSVTAVTRDRATVTARGNEIRQVLVNLLENAIDAASSSSAREVVATLYLDSASAVLCVEDSGPGVPLAERARVFESFYTKKEDGSGMGLAIVRRIVESLGGEVSVASSEALGGAAFSVRLPAATLEPSPAAIGTASVGR